MEREGKTESQLEREGTADFDLERFDKMKASLMNMNTNCNETRGSCDFDFSPNCLINDNDLFVNIKAEALKIVEEQKKILVDQYHRKVDKMKKDDCQLRKSFLKELNLLREAYFMQNSSMIDNETAKNAARVHLFKVEEGLDKPVQELLNSKIKMVTREYLSIIQDQKLSMRGLQDQIVKFKALTPKTFGLMDLSLEEIMDGIRTLYPDAFVIFNTLLEGFPKDFFTGVIEDTFGAFFDNNSEKQLHRKIDTLTKEMLDTIASMTAQFEAEKKSIHT